MGIPLDEVWEMPPLKKLAYGEHLAARDNFEAHCQRVVQAAQEEEFDLDEIASSTGVDIPTGGGSMGNFRGKMPNVNGMSNVGSAPTSGDAASHPALRRYAQSKTGRIVNVVGDDEDDE
jgi:hypothetical protein